MLKRSPSLQSIRAFLQAADTGSFSQAARHLDLTHSAISQQIKGLEAFVGKPLFAREGSGVVLSGAGRILAGALADGLVQIDRALQAVKHDEVSRTLTISVDSELLQTWLNRRLPQLMGQLTDYRLAIFSGTGTDRLLPDRVDVALRYGYGQWTDCEVAPICDDHVVAVASPDFMARWKLKSPVEPARLLDLPLLGYTRRSWSLWLDAAHLEPIEPPTVALFDNVANLLAAAEQGVGVGLSRRLLVADALKDNRLIVPADTLIPTHYNLYAVWPRGYGERAAPVVEVMRAMASESLMPIKPSAVPTTTRCGA